MGSMREEAKRTYGNKLDKMGLGISTSSTGAKAKGHVYPQADGTQGDAQGGRAAGYATEEENERTLSGKKPKPRLDRQAYKKGGRVKGTTVNVIVAPQGGAEAPEPPMPMPPPPMAPPMPKPPMAGPPPMPPGAGPGGPAMPPPMMRKHGGRVSMDAGAGGGKGRLEKIKAYGDRAKPGGKVGTM